MSPKLILIVISLIVSVLFPTVASAQTVLEDIRETGVLKVGIRQDSMPFGYLEGGEWKGICLDTMKELQASLSQELNKPIQLETLVTSLDESSEQGRHRSITSGRIHVECGPNTIRRDPPSGVAYSLPFFYTGTYLFMKPENRLTVNPDGFLQEVTIGVLDDSLTREFITSRYQLAKQKLYEGASGRATAVQDAINGRIDTFASDGILLLGETVRQGITPEQFVLTPNRPLTCISYGLLVPANDPEWKQTIDLFVINPPARSVEQIKALFGENSSLFEVTIAAADQCG